MRSASFCQGGRARLAGECWSCGAVLLVEQADIFRTESHARDETTNHYTFQCSECGVLTDLESVPSRVKLDAVYRSPRDWPLPT